MVDGRLFGEHRGVYAVGHPGRSLYAVYMSAVLAAGPGAVLSHRSAAHLLHLISGPAPPPAVTIPSTNGRTRPGVAIHRVRGLPVLDAVMHSNIPITTVPRTLLDLAPSTTATDLTRACHEAWIHHRANAADIRRCIARNPNKPGARKLLAALGADVTLSKLEDLFLALLRRHGIPLPRTNIDHAGDKVDCHWPRAGLTIELLSFRFHATRHAFERDVARRRRSQHVAFTYGDVVERGPRTAADVAALLSATA